MQYVDFTKKNLQSYTKRIMEKYFDKELFSRYVDMYVNVRYYNQMIEVRSCLEANLNYYLGEIYSKNKSNTSKFIFELFKMYYYLDDVKKFDFSKDLNKYVEEMNDIRESKLGIVDKFFNTDFKKMIMDVQNRQLKFIESLDSKDFYLNLVDVKNNRYYADVYSMVSIPKLYSNYAIRKVWNSTIISENILQIELYLLSSIILKSIINGTFNKYYLVDFKCSLFSKKEKLRRLIDIVRNDICLDLISFSISYTDFVEYREQVLQFIKDGISFNIILDDKFLVDKCYDMLDIFNYIIIVDDKYMISRFSNKKNIILM